jgi:NRPS condensation-like uncharacterized protein
MHSLCHDKRNTFVFRLSVSLTHRIKLKHLQNALDNVMTRFSYFRVHMKSGFFWHYWLESNDSPIVMKDVQYPCEWIPVNTKPVFPLRIRAYYNTLSCEFHHSITDGGGGLQFLKSLLAEYLLQIGAITGIDTSIISTSSEKEFVEFEDPYFLHYKKRIPPPEKNMNAVRFKDKLLKTDKFHITQGLIKTNELLTVSKSHNVTITEYLAAVYLDALQEHFDIQKGPIRILIPINLRSILKSKTMRNFFLWTRPCIDTRLGVYSFEDILKKVKHHMKMTIDEKEMFRQVKVNIGSQLNFFVRILPLFFKHILIRTIYPMLGEKEQSGVLTNLGRVNLPDEIAEHIQSFQFVPPPAKFTKVSLAVISFNNTVSLTFGSLIKSKEVERLFFQNLRKNGIGVKITTNYSEE